MKRFLPLLMAAVLAAGIVSCKDIKGTRGKPGGLDVGDKAYDFKLMDSSGHWVRLSDVQEGWYLVLVLFRGTWCSACLNQMSEFKDNLQKFKDLRAGIAFVSNEPVADLAEFQRQWRFPFPLLTDPRLKVIDAYGVRHVKGHENQDISRPCVLIIDPDKVVRYKYVGQNPQDKPHIAEVLDLLRRFRAAPAPSR